MTTTSYLDRLLEPVADAFTTEFAKTVVDLRVDDVTELHINDLREKANRGTLTQEEDEDYKAFVEAVDVISVIQSKARRFLARKTA